jgi:hypothetical protein
MSSLAWLMLPLIACAPRLPTPPVGLHTSEDFAIVPYPPPPAQVEFVPPRPNERALWVDGHFEWTGNGFAWHRGRWDVPPGAGAYYAPATTVRTSNGQLLYYRGSWHLPDGTPHHGG